MKQVRLCLWSLVDPTPQVESVCQQLVTKAMANENHTFDNQNLECECCECDMHQKKSAH